MEALIEELLATGADPELLESLLAQSEAPGTTAGHAGEQGRAVAEEDAKALEGDALVIAMASLRLPTPTITEVSEGGTGPTCAIACCDDEDALRFNRRLYRCQSCGSWLCFSCLREHVLRVLSGGVMVATCPGADCKAIVDFETLGLFFDDLLAPYRQQAQPLMSNIHRRREIEQSVAIFAAANQHAENGRKAMELLRQLPQQGRSIMSVQASTLCDVRYWVRYEQEQRQQHAAVRGSEKRVATGHRPRPCTRPACPGIAQPSSEAVACTKPAQGACDCPPLQCDRCAALFCLQCETQHGPETKCNPENVASVAAVRKLCQNCPSCGTAVEHGSGCDVMFCTACATFFSFKLGKQISQAHNPEHSDFTARGAKPHLRRPVDLSLSEIVDFLSPDLQDRLGGPIFLKNHDAVRTKVTELRQPEALDLGTHALDQLLAGVPEAALQAILVEIAAVHLARSLYKRRIADLLEHWARTSMEILLDASLRSFQAIEAQRAYTHGLLMAVQRPRCKVWQNGALVDIDAPGFDSSSALLLLSEFVRFSDASRCRGCRIALDATAAAGGLDLCTACNTRAVTMSVAELQEMTISVLEAQNYQLAQQLGQLIGVSERTGDANIRVPSALALELTTFQRSRRLARDMEGIHAVEMRMRMQRRIIGPPPVPLPVHVAPIEAASLAGGAVPAAGVAATAAVPVRLVPPVVMPPVAMSMLPMDLDDL